MAGQIIDNVFYPQNKITQGVTWELRLTFSGSITDISTIVFSLTFKRGTETIIALTEAGGHITHTSTTVLKLKLTDEQTATLSKGAVIGGLLGTSGGDVSEYFLISTTIV